VFAPRGGADAVAMNGKTAGAFVFGAIVGAWLGRALFKWILDVEGTTLIVAVAGVALAGALVCALGEATSARR
jgi:hypothetical protein